MLRVVDLTQASPRRTVHVFGTRTDDPGHGSIEFTLAPGVGGSTLSLLLTAAPDAKAPARARRFTLMPSLETELLSAAPLRTAQELLEASLTGSGQVPLQVEDYLHVFAHTRRSVLHVDIQPLGWSTRRALPYARLAAVVFCESEFAYDEYLAVALGLQIRLPQGAPLKVGMIHRPCQKPMLLLLGEPV